MTTIAPQPFRSYRVPREHGEMLIDPSLADAADVLEHNIGKAASQEFSIGDESIVALRRLARRDLMEKAVAYTTRYTDVCSDLTDVGQSIDRPFVLAGHQPELFHPGVWFKNFALSRLGKSLDSVVINLIVDNDICQSRSIRVPALSGGKPAVESIAMDRPSDVVPYEIASITDRQLFNTFGQRIQETLSPLISDPAIQQLWPAARQAADRTGNHLGLSLAQARHQAESSIGLNTLEVPLSDVCDSLWFLTFALHLLADLPHLHACYNQSVVEYRRAHGIRSNSHPVPELHVQGDWFEVPFWVFDKENPRRRAMYVQRSGSRITLSDRDSIEIELKLQPSFQAMATQLASKLDGSICLRPRALITTMYARLILSDLFLHGIGGGKYDQLNDTIITRLFAVRPPGFIVISATFAPLGQSTTAFKQSPSEIRNQIRQTFFQPETFANSSALPSEWVSQKRDLLQQIPSRGQKQAWHKAVTKVNQQLSECLEQKRQELTVELQTALKCESHQRILGSRDFSFCVYPVQAMQQMFDRFCDRSFSSTSASC